MDCSQKWDFLKYKVRAAAIERSKAIKKIKEEKEKGLMNQIECLLSKQNLSDVENENLKTCSEQLNKMFFDLAKGAFIRSRAKVKRIQVIFLVWKKETENETIL